jgi:hypothetical protein
MIEVDKGDAEAPEGESLVPCPTENVIVSDSDSEDDTKNQRIVHMSDGDYAPDSMSAGELDLFFTDSDDTGPVVPSNAYGYTGIINSHNTCYFNATMQQCNYYHYVLEENWMKHIQCGNT